MALRPAHPSGPGTLSDHEVPMSSQGQKPWWPGSHCPGPRLSQAGRPGSRVIPELGGSWSEQDLQCFVPAGRQWPSQHHLCVSPKPSGARATSGPRLRGRVCGRRQQNKSCPAAHLGMQTPVPWGTLSPVSSLPGSVPEACVASAFMHNDGGPFSTTDLETQVQDTDPSVATCQVQAGG